MVIYSGFTYPSKMAIFHSYVTVSQRVLSMRKPMVWSLEEPYFRTPAFCPLFSEQFPTIYQACWNYSEFLPLTSKDVECQSKPWYNRIAFLSTHISRVPNREVIVHGHLMELWNGMGPILSSGLQGAINGAIGIHIPKKYSLWTMGSRLELRIEFLNHRIALWQRCENNCEHSCHY